MRLTTFCLLLGALLVSCAADPTQDLHFHVQCGGEHVSGQSFQEGGVSFSNIQCRTKESSRTGTFAFKLNPAQQFGPSLQIDSVKKGDVIYASVYRKKGGPGGQLIIASKDKSQYERSAISLEEKVSWELVKCSFVANKDFDFVKVYLWNPTTEDVYFDDLSIDCFRDNEKPVNIAEEDILRIEISKSALDSIEDFRNCALRQEVITSDLKRYFKGTVNLDGKNIPISLRLKGDWVDHLEGEKWSFRVKFKGSNAYQGMKKFSIQDPHTRSFMMEWFAHRLFEKEDVLTTRYQFKVVYINGINKGVYALEEHFDKRLLEYRNRREGPIVKFDESGVWQGHLLQMQEQKDFPKYPYFESAEVLPFSKKKTRRNPVLLNQFLLAQSHMSRFRNLDPILEDYLDVDKMARFIAMCDVMNATHGITWHNQRNYLNPVNTVLEPVAYDCFSGHLMIHYELLGKAALWRSDTEFSSFDALFLNPEFNSNYIYYLKKYASDTYMKDAFKEFEGEIKYYEALLGHEYPMYSFDKDYFLLNQINVKEKVEKYAKLDIPQREIDKKNRYVNSKQNVVFDEVALKVYTLAKDSLSSELKLENYLLSEIEVVGYATKYNKNLILPLQRAIKLDGFVDEADEVLIRFPFQAKSFYYKTSVTGDSLIKAKVSPFPPIEDISILTKESLISSALENENGDFVLKKGSRHVFTKTVYVPRRTNLIVEEGVRIELHNGSRLISYSPVSMLGTQENPIRILGVGERGGAIVLLPQGGSVLLNHVEFIDLTAGNTHSWSLTGGLTIYESSVSLSNCQFINARSEDALNLVRCDFKMDSCAVNQTYSDGFDADFCSGTLSNSSFLRTGNDCIDFSGSEIEIDACKISGSGDKGISGGEHSIIRVRNCSIVSASIAIASKDMSKVTVENTNISSCEYGFAAYRKKAEYGPAQLIVQSAILKDVKSIYLLEKDSKFTIDGREYIGEKQFDIDSMYRQFKTLGL